MQAKSGKKMQHNPGQIQAICRPTHANHTPHAGQMPAKCLPLLQATTRQLLANFSPNAGEMLPIDEGHMQANCGPNAGQK
jgi:hypothetical protein